MPPGVESQGSGPPPRGRLFVAGALGLPLALVGAVVVEALLRAAGSRGAVGELSFAIVAGLTPVVALGLLVQLLTALTGRTRSLLREVRRFEEEMSSDEPAFHEESHVDRVVVWATTRRFVQAVVPFGAGVVTQLVVTEATAIASLLAEVDARVVALALGAETGCLFVYLLFFNVMLVRLSAPPVSRRPTPSPEG